MTRARTCLAVLCLVFTGHTLRPRRWTAALLAGTGVAWVAVNGPQEGPVLWTLSRDHGLTVGDLLGAGAVLSAGAHVVVPVF